jgi:hypothetical protein
MSYRNNFYHT